MMDQRPETFPAIAEPNEIVPRLNRRLMVLMVADLLTKVSLLLTSCQNMLVDRRDDFGAVGG